MPLDGWKFDSADGKSMSKPLYRIRSYAVEVRDGLVILKDARGAQPFRPGASPVATPVIRGST
jgi:hypothetical protein